MSTGERNIQAGSLTSCSIPRSSLAMHSDQSTVNELFFTGPGDPRHKCVAIGYHNGAPIVYKFETLDLPQGTRTTVCFSRRPTVAGLTHHLSGMY